MRINSLKDYDDNTSDGIVQSKYSHRRMLNGAVLPKFGWGKTVATALFLLHCPSSKTIGGDTPHYRMVGKHTNLFILRTTGTRPHGGRQAHLPLTSTPDLLIT